MMWFLSSRDAPPIRPHIPPAQLGRRIVNDHAGRLGRRYNDHAERRPRRRVLTTAGERRTFCKRLQVGRREAVLTGHLRSIGGLSVAALAFGLAACGGGGTSSGTTSKTSGAAPSGGKPVTVGISLSLCGDFSDPGNAALRGYRLWADTVKAKGGILGRKVKLKVVDDT
jgi:hypothetical protein